MPRRAMRIEGWTNEPITSPVLVEDLTDEDRKHQCNEKEDDPYLELVRRGLRRVWTGRHTDIFHAKRIQHIGQNGLLIGL